MKKFAMLLMTVVLGTTVAVGLTGCSDKSPASLDDGVLTVGYTLFAPMNYMEGNKLVGFDTELAEQVAKDLGVEVEFKEIHWNNKVMDLNSKAIDCVWNGMTITDELKEAMAITDPYMENEQVVVCKKENAAKYTDIASLSQIGKVGYEKGSAGEKVSADLSAEKNEYTAQRDTLLAVTAEAIDAAIIDLTMAVALVKDGTSYSELAYVRVGFPSEEYGIGFRSGDTVTRNTVNKLIALYKLDGTFDTLTAKYFN